MTYLSQQTYPSPRLAAETLRLLAPPPQLSLAEWAEANFVLAEGSSARPGRFRLWPYQHGILDAIGDPEVTRVSVIKSARIGYALDVTTPIATPTGWSRMGDLRRGDQVYDEAGRTCRITYVSPIYQDHPCYRVTFCDGSSIIADAGHRWLVHSDRSFELMLDGRFVRGPGARASYVGVLNTEQIVRCYRARRGRSCLAIENAAPLKGEWQELPVPPYTLGLWLGDGHSVTPRITQFVGDIETAKYIEAEGIKVSIEHIDLHCPNNRTYLLDAKRGEPSPWARKLRRLGLLTTKDRSCGTKHIPQMYLRATVEQRLELLRGLMDSDGTIGRHGFAEFSVTSEVLARGVFELICSLGYKATLSPREPKRPEHLRQYRVVFRPTPERNPFRLKRKASRVLPAPKPTITNRRRIVGVRRVRSVPVRCISVDSPSHLFLAGRQMVPTHNTKCLMAAIAARVDVDPCAMILLVPTDEDARGYAVDEIEPAFDQAPRLQGLMLAGADSRSTLTVKQFIGGANLKILAARSPRNLRRHDAKVLLVDEEDGMDLTVEGDPVALAERRTMAHPDRKIIRGSTPTDEVNSSINRAYAESDKRIYEVPCPHCGAGFEIVFKNILWPRGEPERAVCYCPHCYEASNTDRRIETREILAERPQLVIEEKHKTQMVASGSWVATAPHVKGHAGFRLNTFISLLANAKWGILAAEFERAKRAGPAELQVFANTVEGRVWRTSLDNLDEGKLAERVEAFGINAIPREVLLIVAGVDTQDDRFEGVLWGFSESEAFLLAHDVIWGDPSDSVTQASLDAWLKQTFAHPNGWRIGIEAAAIDSQGHKTQAVYDFCRPKLARRIYPIISRVGSRRIWDANKTKMADGTRLFTVGHDQAKALVLDHLALPLLDEAGGPMPGRCRFSADLPADTFDQLAGEKRQIRYVHNRVVTEFRPKKPGQRVEALDATCYAWAVKRSMRVNWAERAARRSEAKASVSFASLSEKLNRR